MHSLIHLYNGAKNEKEKQKSEFITRTDIYKFIYSVLKNGKSLIVIS